MTEPGTLEHRRCGLAHLEQTLRRIALEPRDAIAPRPPYVGVPDELALDLAHSFEVCRAWRSIEGEVVERVGAIDDLHGGMSGRGQAGRWTRDALSRDPGWQQARAMARDALRLAAGSR